VNEIKLCLFCKYLDYSIGCWYSTSGSDPDVYSCLKGNFNGVLGEINCSDISAFAQANNNAKNCLDFEWDQSIKRILK